MFPLKQLFFALWVAFFVVLPARGEPVCIQNFLSIVQSPTDRRVRDMLERRALDYFLQGSHPTSGWVLDRLPINGLRPANNRIASLAGTGMGLTVLSHATSIKRLKASEAEEIVLKTLRSALHLEHHHGWLPHFVDWETGHRITNTEISTIDTALFLAGALYAAEVFKENSEIYRLANQLYERIDFKLMMTNGGEKPDKWTLSMGWNPFLKEYLHADWDSYSEHIILQILGLGHPNESKRLPPKAWRAWERHTSILPDGAKLVGADLPLFAHQYPWIWLDPLHFKDTDFNAFENSRTATLRDQTLSKLDRNLSPYQIWGLSASDGPHGYRAFRHGDGFRDKGENDGTVCPGCVAASMIFAPETVLPYLVKLMTGPYKNDLVGQYGFVDAFNPDQNWIGQDSLAITVAPVYLSSANLKDRSVWNTFHRIGAVQRALRAIAH